MSIDTVFKPTGNTVLIVNTAAQVMTQNAGGVYMFRVRNLASVAQYFSWGQSAAQATQLNAAAPTSGNAGVPNTIGMLPGSVETFEIPAASFFIAGSATGFEFTPGIGS